MYIQELLDKGYVIKEISKITGIKIGTLVSLHRYKKINFPIGYKEKVFKIKRIVRLTPDGEFIKKYDTLSSVNEDGFSPSSVNKVLFGKQKFSYNSFWVLEDDYINGNYILPEKDFDKFSLSVMKYDMNNNYICSYDSIYEAEKQSMSNRSEIYRVASGSRISSRKEKWKFKETI